MTRVLVGVVLFVMAGCGPKTKPVLVKFDAACLSAVQTIAQVELNLSNFNKITPAQALKIRHALRPVIDLGEQATEALLVWQPGQATPTSVIALAARLTDLLETVAQLLPPGEAQAKLVSAIAFAQSAWAMVMMTINAGDVPTPEMVGGATCQAAL